MSQVQGFSFSFVENVRQDNAIQAKHGLKGGSWLVAFATAMGKIANDINKDMMALAKKIDQAQKDKEPANELTAQLTALSQLFKMVTEATNNVIKAVGEGNTSLARKQ